MNAKETLRVCLGSAITYAIVASCSASNNGPSASNSPTGGVGSKLVGGAPIGELGGGSGRGGSLTSLIDAIANPVPDAEASTSGTRLRAVYRTANDGSKEYLANWWDSQRNEYCWFIQMYDGSSRCLPYGADPTNGQINYTGVGTYYSDAGCTSPLAVTGTCTAGLKYAIENSSCPQSVKIYSLGQQFTDGVYTKSGTSCNSATISASYTLYALGPEVPPSSFVSATVAHD